MRLDELRAAVRAYRQAEREFERATAALAAARAKRADAKAALAARIVEEAAGGMKQVDIVAETGYTRERVRQICKKAEEESD